MIGRWFRMLWPRKRRPSTGAADAHARAEESLAKAQRDRLNARRLRAVAEEAEDAVRSHNTANRYADWLEDRITRGGS